MGFRSAVHSKPCHLSDTITRRCEHACWAARSHCSSNPLPLISVLFDTYHTPEGPRSLSPRVVDQLFHSHRDPRLQLDVPQPARLKTGEALQELDRQIRGCRVTLVKLQFVPPICLVLFSLCCVRHHQQLKLSQEALWKLQPGHARASTNSWVGPSSSLGAVLEPIRWSADGRFFMGFQ